MNRFKFGRYIHKETFIHKLNPFIKLLSFTLLATVTLFDGGYLKLAFSFAILLVLLYFSNISLREFYPSIKAFRFFFIFTFLVQLFFTSTGNFSITPSQSQVSVATIMTLRFIFVIAFSALFTITTTPSDIARALFVFVKPLKAFKVNISDIAISLLVAVRFIPLLFEESEKIVIAQTLRNGWDKETKFREKLSFFIKAESFVIPLFVRVIRYAEQISITLHYRKSPENIMALPHLISKDYMALVSVIIIAVVSYAI